MPGRSFTSSGASYRFKFNGKEMDEEGMGGGGSTYDYGFRIYNPNLVRFLSTDPLFKSFPWNSPYAFAENKLIQSIDLEGLESFEVQHDLFKNSQKGNTKFNVQTAYDIDVKTQTVYKDDYKFGTIFYKGEQHFNGGVITKAQETVKPLQLSTNTSTLSQSVLHSSERQDGGFGHFTNTNQEATNRGTSSANNLLADLAVTVAGLQANDGTKNEIQNTNRTYSPKFAPTENFTVNGTQPTTTTNIDQINFSIATDNPTAPATVAAMNTLTAAGFTPNIVPLAGTGLSSGTIFNPDNSYTNISYTINYTTTTTTTATSPETIQSIKSKTTGKTAVNPNP